MSAFGRSIAVIALGFALLIVQSAIGALVPVHPFVPNLLLPMVIFLGVSPDVHIVRGAVISFVLGYLMGTIFGSSWSLQAFVLVATFMLARGAGLRLFLRGPVFQVVLTFVVSLLAGGAILALRAIFEPPSPLPVRSPMGTAFTLLAPAVVTALAAPLVFIAVRRVDSIAVRRQETGAS